MESLINYLIKAWDNGKASRSFIVGIFIFLICLAVLPYGLFLEGVEMKNPEILKGLIDISKIATISAFFLFLLFSVVKGKRTEEEFKGFIQEVETVIKDLEPQIKFNKGYNSTNMDIKYNFLPPGGQSFFFQSRRKDEKENQFKGIWILQSENILKTLFLSYDGETNWIFDLDNDIKFIPKNFQQLFNDVGGKETIKHPDGNIAKWKKCKSYKDIFK